MSRERKKEREREKERERKREREKTQNGWTLVAEVLHCRDLSWWRQKQQECETNGDKWKGVHPARFACWRWEQDFETSYGKNTRKENVDATKVGWKAIAQERNVWKSLENTFLTSL